MMNWTRPSRWMLAGMVPLLLSSCGGDSLDDDPKGAEACRLLIESIEAGEDDTETKIGALLGAGEAAVEAKTEAIRDSASTVEDLEQFPIVDVDELTAVCEDAGVEVPGS